MYLYTQENNSPGCLQYPIYAASVATHQKIIQSIAPSMHGVCSARVMNDRLTHPFIIIELKVLMQ